LTKIIPQSSVCAPDSSQTGEAEGEGEERKVARPVEEEEGEEDEQHSSGSVDEVSRAKQIRPSSSPYAGHSSSGASGR
jgi:hypothetical protein